MVCSGVGYKNHFGLVRLNRGLSYGNDRPVASMSAQPPTHDPGRVLACPGEVTLLESGLPFRELSLVVDADRRATDPVYTAHRWWARRPPALMRGLLLAAALPADCSPDTLWEAFASTAMPLAGLRVHDPFVGGGSTLVEAGRLGATVSGSDIDPLAVEIVRHALHPASAEEVRAATETLLTHLRRRVGHLYPGKDDGTPVHYFWLHEVTCPSCSARDLLYRNLVLARDTGQPGAVVRDAPLTVFCPIDLTIHHLNDPDRVELRHCGRRLPLGDGTFHGGKYTCPECGSKWTHRDLKTGLAPRRLLAIEETVPGGRRCLRTPRPSDLAAVATAERLIRRRTDIDLPRGQLCTDRQDLRPLSYGINAPIELFSDRQLVVLGTAMAWLRNAELSSAARRAVTLGLSNTLTTNNKLCGYATDYGRLAPLFSVRGYPLPALPVELNPLHPKGGRGTIRHCLERVARSADSTVRRHSWSARSKAPEPIQMTFSRLPEPDRVICTSASNAAEVDGDDEVDLCVFDPPYFDYIAYSELSEFYRCWLETPVASGTPLLPHGDDPAERFGLDLATCLRTTLRQLAPGRPLAFTYHSANTEAWRAVGIALDDAKLAVTALWPVRSDGHMGHHSHPGNCEWDLVIVCRRLVETRPAGLNAQVQDWVVAAKPLSIGEADRTSMSLAIATAAPRFAHPERTRLTEGAES